MNRRVIVWLAGLTLVSLVAPAAKAQTSVAGLMGYGADFEDGELNPFGFSVGARVGHTLPARLYLGATGLFHAGETEENAGVETTFRMLQIGAEVGYDAAVTSSVIVRPYVGLGLNVSFASVKLHGFGFSAKDSDNETDLYLNLGAALLYAVNPRIFLGVDLRSSNVFMDDETLNGFIFLATLGLRL